MRFRPHPVVTVVILVCVLIQLRLGLWQYRRYVQQTERLENVRTRMQAGPADNADVAQQSADALIWRKARLTGTFLDAQTYITGRFEFGGPGFDVIGVLDVDGGPRLLVNRGWIPLDDWDSHLSSVPTGPAEVEGLLLPADESMLGSGCYRTGDTEIPARDGLPARWGGPNWPTIAASFADDGITDLAPVVLIAGPELEKPEDKVRDPLPAQGWIARPKHIQHLEYMGQWILIAMVFTGGWVYLGIRRGRETAS
jgi:surfeit locus 1 family protein